MRALAIDVRQRLGDARPSVVALCATSNERPVVVIATNETARAAGVKAGDLVKTASTVLGGGGGGKPDLAQGGGQHAEKIDDALAAVVHAIEGAQ